MASAISNYAKRMAKLSARIFGEVARPTPLPAMKVVKIFEAKPVNKRPEFYDYYPKHIEITSLMKRVRCLGLFRLVFCEMYRNAKISYMQDFKENLVTY